ncbi:MFS transporter [Vulcanimicrobium alpinum]|uniref:MFS transporter n=1 Tax=Vulcanimicrobium alpinum TaxID=3016050 RepID=A0AAN1XXT3_UNVUL|nr:MFS transporter [Vulcanimicrobium alpinum]BDE07367.1 MFS transporter [Vulcanimicrobium alpinum]
MPADGVRLGLAANARQFWLLVVVNAFVGAMVGMERDVLPLVGTRLFGLTSETAVLSFIVTFGITKALANLYAGHAADRVGRKPLLVAGWLIAIPVPFLLMFAPSWNGIVFANVLLGINQGLCWSMTVVMKIDLVGPRRRGLAMGLNEFAGYLAVGVAAYASGIIAAAYGLRPWPFALGIVSIAAALLISVCFVRETHGHARVEAAQRDACDARPSFGALFARVSWRDRTLSAISQAGLVNNLNDGLAWGLLPLHFAAAGLALERIALLAAVYPATWGLCQLATGALSDRMGRKGMIVGGMWSQAVAIALFLTPANFAAWFAAAVLLGVGTAMVYPTLLAAIGDVVDPLVRASSVGVYRLWRDSGYAFGALLAGAVAQTLGHNAAIAIVATITFLSGAIVAMRMRETCPSA